MVFFMALFGEKDGQEQGELGRVEGGVQRREGEEEEEEKDTRAESYVVVGGVSKQDSGGETIAVSWAASLRSGLRWDDRVSGSLSTRLTSRLEDVLVTAAGGFDGELSRLDRKHVSRVVPVANSIANRIQY